MSWFHKVSLLYGELCVLVSQGKSIVWGVECLGSLLYGSFRCLLCVIRFATEGYIAYI